MKVFEATGSPRPKKYHAQYRMPRLPAQRQAELEIQQIGLFRQKNRGWTRRQANSPGLTLIKNKKGEYLTASKIRGLGTTVHLLAEARLYRNLTLGEFQSHVISLFHGRGSRRFVDRVLQDTTRLDQSFLDLSTSQSETELITEFCSLLSSIATCGGLQGAIVDPTRKTSCIVTNIVAVPLPGTQVIDDTVGCVAINDGSFIDAQGRVLFGMEFKHLDQPPADGVNVFPLLNSAKFQANQHMHHESATRGCLIVTKSCWKCITREHQGVRVTTHQYQGSLFPGGDDFMMLVGPNAEQGRVALVTLLAQIIYYMILDQLEHHLIPEPRASILKAKMK